VPGDGAEDASEGGVEEVGFDGETREWTLDAEAHAQRLDRVLASLVPEFSRSHLQGLLAAGEVSLDGALATTASRKVRAGQRLRIRLVPPAEARAFTPQDIPLDVVFEDAHLLVIHKPAGLVVHPAPGNWSGTLLNGLLARDPKAARQPRGHRPSSGQGHLGPDGGGTQPGGCDCIGPRYGRARHQPALSGDRARRDRVAALHDRRAGRT
jgi:23S rRNA pseudouridine1911/1915/1917 synthase